MPNLVLLPGWGICHSARMPGANLQLLALPALENNSLSETLQQLSAQLPDQAWLIGWSLGGMLAVQLASLGKAQGVVSLASNVCFSQRHDWATAMPEQQFAQFQQGCATNLSSSLKRFRLLCAQGASDPRALAQGLTPFKQTPQQAVQSLQLLASLDNRELLPQLAVPQLHIFASADALVPIAAAEAIQQLAPQAQVQRLEASHALVLEQAEALARLISEFIQGATHAA